MPHRPPRSLPRLDPRPSRLPARLRRTPAPLPWRRVQCKWDLKTSLHHVDTKRFVQPNSGFINFLIGLERSLFGTNSCTAVDFGYAADSGELCGAPPPTPMRR